MYARKSSCKGKFQYLCELKTNILKGKANGYNNIINYSSKTCLPRSTSESSNLDRHLTYEMNFKGSAKVYVYPKESMIPVWLEQRHEQLGSLNSLLTSRLSLLIISLIRGSFCDTCRHISLTVPFG